jgi:hypothetical protein
VCSDPAHPKLAARLFLGGSIRKGGSVKVSARNHMVLYQEMYVTSADPFLSPARACLRVALMEVEDSTHGGGGGWEC